MQKKGYKEKINIEIRKPTIQWLFKCKQCEQLIIEETNIIPDEDENNIFGIKSQLHNIRNSSYNSISPWCFTKINYEKDGGYRIESAEVLHECENFIIFKNQPKKVTGIIDFVGYQISIKK